MQLGMFAKVLSSTMTADKHSFERKHRSSHTCKLKPNSYAHSECTADLMLGISAAKEIS